MRYLKLSIIIPCFNRSNYLKSCIDSIIAQYFNSLEIIVIDDNSQEDIRSLLLSWYSCNKITIKYVRNPENYYPAFSKNIGITISEGKYLLFIDSDTEFFQPDTLRNSIRFLETHDDFAIIGGEAGFDANGRHISVHGLKFKIKRSYTIDVRDHLFEPHAYKEVDVMDSSNMMSKKDLILQVGGFDPGYLYPHEDSDLCLRLKNVGYKIGIAFDSAIIHKRTASERLNQIYYVSRARIRYQLKHFGIKNVHFYNVFDKPIIYSFLNKTPSVYAKLIPDMHIYPVPWMKDPHTNHSRRSSLAAKALMTFFYLHLAILNNIINLRRIVAARNKSFMDDPLLLKAAKAGEVICS
jgi:GT2 family glycosyltransferase